LYWRDKDFDKVDWKNEPKESLPQLYKERAEQIRNDYDYVVLCYSGGIDSTNILETFYYNNIHIDEIVSIGSFSQHPDKEMDLYNNKDIYCNVKNNLNRLHLPNTKKTFIDYTEYFNDIKNFSLIRDYGDEYYKYIGSYPSITYLFWYDLGKFLKTKKNTALVFGNEKPFLKRNNLDKFYIHFSDASICTYSKFEFDNNVKINFYSDPEGHKIMRKQLHIIKDFYLRCVSVEQSMTPEFFKTNYNDIIHKLVYDLRHPLEWVSKKNTNMFLSGRDLYILDHKNSCIYEVYRQALIKLMKQIPLNCRYEVFTKEYYIT
jgi:hypothetical protein